MAVRRAAPPRRHGAATSLKLPSSSASARARSDGLAPRRPSSRAALSSSSFGEPVLAILEGTEDARRHGGEGALAPPIHQERSIRTRRMWTIAGCGACSSSSRADARLIDIAHIIATIDGGSTTQTQPHPRGTSTVAAHLAPPLAPGLTGVRRRMVTPMLFHRLKGSVERGGYLKAKDAEERASDDAPQQVYAVSAAAADRPRAASFSGACMHAMPMHAMPMPMPMHAHAHDNDVTHQRVVVALVPGRAAPS